jgi:hypothetical protein
VKKIICLAVLILSVFAAADAVFAWNAEGVIPGTEISYSGMTVSKDGVAVKLTNNSGNDARVSLKLTFFDKDGNGAGYSLFGLRVIAAGSEVEISRNYLTGKWKSCKNSERIVFEKMTYELIYD